MIVTEWRTVDPRKAVDRYLREYPRRPKRIRAEYGINEDGRFEVHSRIYEKAHGKWRETAWGPFLGDLAAAFPELEPYMKWDMFTPDEIAGWAALEKFWTEYRAGGYPTDFQYQASLGALPDDVMPPRETPWPEVRAWLQERHPRLVAAFRRDMRELARAAGPGFRAGPGFEGPKAWYPGSALE